MQPSTTTTHPYAPELRRRADRLIELAAELERSLVTSLTDDAAVLGSFSRRAELCERMLRCNLHQLHRAADDLRLTAFRFRQRADELDLHHRSAA